MLTCAMGISITTVSSTELSSNDDTITLDIS